MFVKENLNRKKKEKTRADKEGRERQRKLKSTGEEISMLSDNSILTHLNTQGKWIEVAYVY